MVYESLEKAVSDADVIVTVTMATEPVVLGKWLKLGAVVCCKFILLLLDDSFPTQGRKGSGYKKKQKTKEKKRRKKQRAKSKKNQKISKSHQ